MRELPRAQQRFQHFTDEEVATSTPLRAGQVATRGRPLLTACGLVAFIFLTAATVAAAWHLTSSQVHVAPFLLTSHNTFCLCTC